VIADLHLLGPAALDDTARRAAIESQVGRPVTAVEGAVTEVAYDVPSITTVGRWWVRGTARTEDESHPFAFFVKAVQPWSRSPFFEHVPVEHRQAAAAIYPWRTEPAVYRSALADALPSGLGMPRAGAVAELDGPLAVMWLDAVEADEPTWDEARYARAAHLLGRLAARPATRSLATVGGFHLDAAHYLDGRVSMQVLPILRSPIWEHPALRAFADLRQPLMARIPDLAAIAAEIDALPRLAAHGDACPNNLLADRADPDGFVLIDFGLWNELAVGHDLTQLLVGDIQIGRRSASALGGLASLAELLLTAYADGLDAEGLVLDLAVLRRSLALHLFLFAGLTALPFEMLDGPPEVLANLVEDRAEMARFSLDLLAATDPS
jgi:hypothetical protein